MAKTAPLSYERFVEDLPVPAAVVRERDGLLLCINNPALHQFDLERDEVSGRAAPVIWNGPEERAAFIQSVGTEGRIDDFVTHFRWSDGDQVAVTVSASRVIHNEEPAFLLVLKTVEPRRQPETTDQERLQNQHRLDLAVRRAGIGHATWSVRDQTFTHRSMEYIQLLGPERQTGGDDEVAVMNWCTMHPDDLHLTDNADKALRAGNQIEVEHRVLAEDGTVRWCRQVCVPVREPDGSVPEVLVIAQEITDQKSIEAHLVDSKSSLETLVEKRTRELLASDAKFRTLAEYSHVGLAVFQAGRYVFLNRAFATLHGYEPGELLDLQSSELVDARDLQLVQDLRTSLTEGPITKSRIEYRGIRKNGNRIWLETDGAPVSWEGMPAVLHSIIDISERKASESALLETQSIITSLLENAPYAFSVKSRSGRYLMFTAGGVEALRHAPKEHSKKTLGELLTPESAASIEAADLRVLETGQPVGVDQEYLVAVGQSVLRLIKFPIRGGTGEVENIGTIAVDMTKELENRHRIANSERATREIFESSLIGAGVYRRGTDTVTFANTKLLEILGTTLEDLNLNSLGSFWRDPDERVDLLATLQQQGSAQKIANLRKADGSDVFCMVSARTSPQDEDEFLFWIDDLTNLQNAQTELITAKERAERADRAKSDFLSSMSHELRTPLNSVLGFAQLLAGDTTRELDAEQSQYVQMILTSGQILLSLINDVLDLTLIQDGHVTLDRLTFDLGPVVADCVQLVTPMLSQNDLTLDFQAEGLHGAKALGDPSRLQQVMLNLLQNAVKYNRAGGSVSVRREASAPGTVRIAVSDTGRGIAPEEAKQIFQPFERLHEKAGAIEGTGIGLTIAKRLIEAMGGEIGLNSELGRGSTFWIELPTAQS